MIKYSSYWGHGDGDGYIAIVSCDVGACHVRSGYRIPDTLRVVTLPTNEQLQRVDDEFRLLGWLSQGDRHVCPEHGKAMTDYEEKRRALRREQGRAPMDQYRYFDTWIKELEARVSYALGMTARPMSSEPQSGYEIAMQRQYAQLSREIYPYREQLLKVTKPSPAELQQELWSKKVIEVPGRQPDPRLSNPTLGGRGMYASDIQNPDPYVKTRAKLAQGMARPYHCGRSAGKHPGYLRVLVIA